MMNTIKNEKIFSASGRFFKTADIKGDWEDPAALVFV